MGPPHKGDTICQAFEAPVQVTFNPKPIPCITPRVTGLTIAQARLNLRESRCKVGKVAYAPSTWIQDGRVISQDPKPFWRRQQGAVNLVVGKGRH